ncbi:reverse transcriptase domain-containing protein [Tanacetum coccineum]
MIIEAEIGGHCIHRMYVDGGSASEILYEHCFTRLRPEIKNQLVPTTTPLIGFSGEIIWPIGQIQLLVKIGDDDHSTSAWMNFVVVRSPSSYNGIIGRPGVRKLQVVPSTAHGMLKLPVEGGVITLKSSRLVPLECALVSGSEGTLSAIKPMVEERIKVAINPEYPEQTVMIGSTLTEEGRNKLCGLLQRKLDIFAWKPADMTGVPRHIAEHRLNVRKGCSPVRQKKRGQAADRNQAIQEEVGKLVEAGIMREVHYHDWLSNPVMVKKHDDSWRMCVYFKDLNKACPKDGYPLPEIDWKTAEAEEAFKQMKQLIAEPPVFVAPMEKEELIIYLAAAKETVLSRPEVAGRLQKWSIELGEYAIHYRPRVSVKGQILADFIVERPKEDSPDTLMEEEEKLPEPWILFTDGSSCTDGSGAGLILTNPEGMEFTYALRFKFDATNNEAEYETLIAGLKIAEQVGVKNLQAKVDSRLVANQVNGTYVAKEIDMIRYPEKVKMLTNSFEAFSIKQVPKSKNKKADALSKIASTSFAHLRKQVLVEELKEKSISATEVLAVVQEKGDTWMTPIFKYLTDGTLPAEVKKSRAVRRKLWRMHTRTRSVVAKALRIGYYWPTIHEDTRTLIRACQDCQVHKPIPRNPQQKLTPITSPWPFYKWGIDIDGPFPEGPGKDNIICRFGLSGEIISNNGKQFQDNPFKDWCEKLCIRQHFAYVKHPQTNSLVERANRSLGEGIKARLDERSKNWMEELPHVLWAYCTMIKSRNGDTPFSLTYGTEVVIPAEIGMPTLRTAEVDLVQNNKAL